MSNWIVKIEFVGLTGKYWSEVEVTAVEPIGGQDLTDYKAKARAALEGKTDVS